MKSIKRLVMVTVVLLGFFSTPKVMAATNFGPVRPNFTEEKPPTYITFNSISNNKIGGAEWVFIRTKDVTGQKNDGKVAGKLNYHNVLPVKTDHSYMVLMLVSNDARANLKLNPKNVRASIEIPSTSSNDIDIKGIISADNCGPQNNQAMQFWSTTRLTGKNIKVSYVPGSAKYWTDAKSFNGSGFTLPDDLKSSEGTPLGYSSLNGVITGNPGQNEYVTFLVNVSGQKNLMGLGKGKEILLIALIVVILVILLLIVIVRKRRPKTDNVRRSRR